MSFRDPTLELLSGLEPETRWRAIVFINALRSVGVPAFISSARRDDEEQRRLVEAGRSRTFDSLHLRGRAFDFDVVGFAREQIPDSFWSTVGPWAEQQLGLTWGGRFTTIFDPGHFELPNRPPVRA